MPRTYTPVIKFANSGSQEPAFKSMVQRAEKTQQYPSDHVVQQRHFSGVLRKAREWRRQVVRYLFAPVPARCIPSYCDPAVSGSTAVILGANFTSGSRVFFDELESSNAVIVSPTQLSCTIPVRGVGDPLFDVEDLKVVVKIVRPDGMTGSRDDIFNYEKRPVISSIVPDSGPIQGGEISTITGQYFKDNSSVTLVSASVSSSAIASWFDSNTIEILTRTAPATGTYRVIVTSPSGQSSVDPVFYVYDNHVPVLLGPELSVYSSDLVTETYALGRYFLQEVLLVQTTQSSPVTPTWNGTSWSYPGWDLLPSTWVSSGSVAFSTSIYSPPFIGTGSMMALHPDGKLSISASIVYASGVPVITRVSPSIITIGAVVAVTGAHFSSSEIGSFNIVSCSFVNTATSVRTSAAFTLLSAQNMETTTPTIGTGFYRVRVSSSNGVGMSFASLTYSLAPQITAVTPSTGGIAGGYYVSITGSGFYPSTSWVLIESDNTTFSTLPSTFLSTGAARVRMPFRTGSFTTGPAKIRAINFGQYSSDANFMFVTGASGLSGNLFIPNLV